MLFIQQSSKVVNSGGIYTNPHPMPPRIEQPFGIDVLPIGAIDVGECGGQGSESAVAAVSRFGHARSDAETTARARNSGGLVNTTGAIDASATWR